MRLQSFRVANYKSIEGSGACYLSDRITILAGKNEAGKSSLLEALCDFNGERPMRPMLSQSNVLELSHRSHSPSKSPSQR